MILDERLNRIVEKQPYPLLFATVSGAHLYGFPSPDSDYDLRGAHILPLEKVLGFDAKDETVESSQIIEGLDMDIVSHDIRKFFGLLLKKNGYVLEQLYSPLVVRSSPEHEELKEIAKGCITRHHVHHYLGFLQTQWKLFQKESPPRVKPLLYVFRVILTGIHLMRTGVVNSNLVELNEELRLPYIPDLISRKQAGENSTLSDSDLTLFASEKDRLEILLKKAGENSRLPESPSARPELEDLLIRLRLGRAED